MRTDPELIYGKLAPEQQAIWDCIGSEAYLKLVSQFGGMSVYVAKIDTIERLSRDEKIRGEFNGVNFKYLAAKYNLSERTIRMIVGDIIEEVRNAPMEGQVTFDDLL